MGKEKIDLTNVKRVLVCIFKYHGDVLLTSPVYTALKKEMPEAKIDVYLFKETRPMLEGHPSIDQFLEFDQSWRKLFFFRRLIKELMMWRKVRQRKYDIVLNLTSGDRGGFVAKISGAKIRVGVQAKDGKKKSVFFTKLLRETVMPRHIVERNLDIVRAIGIFPSPEERELFFFIPKEEREKVDKLVPSDFILIHPASRCSYKHWPKEKFTDLIKRLIDRGEQVVISGGPSLEEKEYIQGILQPIAHLPIINLAGQLGLKGLGALIEKSKMLITVDSVPSHIASALKKKLVIIFGPSDDVKWGPWKNPHAQVVRLNVPCMRCDQEGCGGSWHADCLTNLPVDQVFCSIINSLY